MSFSPRQVLAADSLNAAIANPYVKATGSPNSRYMADRLAEVANVLDFGAVGNGSTDDTAAIQAAADAIEDARGGMLYFPPNKTFLFTSTVFVPSLCWVRGGGWSTILKAKAGATWTTNTTGTSTYTTGSFRTLFANRNFLAETITDEDILFSDFAADLDSASSVQRKALASMISTRNTQFSRILTRGGGSVISHLHTEVSNVHDCVFLDFHSTAADHYSGFRDAKVLNNHLRQLAISSSNPAIQATGTNNDNTANTSDGILISGNKIEVTGSYLASVGVISVTAAGAGGVVDNVEITDNDIDCGGRPAGGILCYGGGDNWVIARNTVRNVSDYNCIFAIPNGLGTLTRVNVSGNRVLDSTRTSGSGRILTVDAVGSTVVDNDILGCTATTGTHVTGDGSVLQLGSTYGSTLTADYGTSGSVTVNGAITGTWTPQPLFGGVSTGITGTFSGTWHRNGPYMDITGSLTFTSKGSATGSFTVTGLPISVPESQSGNFEVTTGANFQSSVTSAAADPIIRASTTGLTFVTKVIGGSNLTNTDFANNTVLAFTGRVRIA